MGFAGCEINPFMTKVILLSGCSEPILIRFLLHKPFFLPKTDSFDILATQMCKQKQI